MRAGLTDPHGPPLWRRLPYVLPLLVMLWAFWGPGPGLVIGITSMGIFNLIGLIGLRQRKPRQVDLECGPGYVEVKNAGSRNQRISAKDLTGATTARIEGGALLLTLQHRKRRHPITLELPSEAEADKVRHALGIGHGGFGTLAWQSHSDNTTRVAVAGRMIAVCVALLTLAISLTASADAGFIVAMFFGQIGFIGAVLGVIGLLARQTEPSIVMAREGLRLRTPRGWFALPYDQIQHIEDHARALVFTVPPPFHQVAVERVGPLLDGPSDQERKVLVSQIMAASLRARGLGPRKNDVTGRVDMLRRHGETAREWLVRLDMAGQMLSAGSGYRGNTLDAEDLWAILEDPEADAELRAASARVLRHIAANRVRIDAAVAAVRDESTNRRLRIAVEDNLDEASEELAFLDASDTVAEEERRARITA